MGLVTFGERVGKKVFEVVVRNASEDFVIVFENVHWRYLWG
jgi:hypothetical protein